MATAAATRTQSGRQSEATTNSSWPNRAWTPTTTTTPGGRTFTIAAGAIWAEYAWGRYWGWDPKETWSLVTWVIFAGYLHARATAGWKGRRAALLAILGFAMFWWNFIGVNLVFTGLHSSAGV